MKTFLDLKEGDYVYYWDKGKIHAQKIRKIVIHEYSLYNSWCNSIDINKHIRIYLNRSINPIEIVSYNGKINDFGCDYGIYIAYNGMYKYSCLEAIKNWLEKRKNCIDKKARISYERYQKMINLSKKYENALND